MIHKRVLVSDRVRRPPPEGWSWIDRRFLREHASALSRDAILVYFFLAAVSDRHGLSFYNEGSIAARLRITEAAVAAARQELLARDLIAYTWPLTQVLSLRRTPVLRQGGLSVIGDLLHLPSAVEGGAHVSHRSAPCPRNSEVDP